MHFSIHRGQNQIGGSVIEIATEKTKIILDVGMELDEASSSLPAIPGLFQGVARYDAILISHYHLDHVGLLEYTLPEIPVYMGKSAYQIYALSRTYAKKNDLHRKALHDLESGKSFEIGDIRVTPYLCDHSAFDAYMFLIESGGQKLLYTGDYRSHGRMDFDRLLAQLPNEVDMLITEGTTLTREEGEVVSEVEIESMASDEIRKHNGPVFVMASSTNISRMVSMFKATRKNGRVFAYDAYAAQIALMSKESIPNPNTFDAKRLKVFIVSHDEYEFLKHYPQHKIGCDTLARTRFVAMIRSSMLSWIKKMASHIKESTHKEKAFENGLLIYSMWHGYKTKEALRELLDYVVSEGMEIRDIHTSGHADAGTIRKLIEKTNSKRIIPVHTENAQWFVDTYGCERVVLRDGVIAEQTT